MTQKIIDSTEQTYKVYLFTYVINLVECRLSKTNRKVRRKSTVRKNDYLVTGGVSDS